MQPDRILCNLFLCSCFPFEELPHGPGLASALVDSNENAREKGVFTQSSVAADEAFDRTDLSDLSDLRNEMNQMMPCSTSIHGN